MTPAPKAQGQAPARPSGVSDDGVRTDLVDGSINSEGCLKCPWHEATYDVESGWMIDGPQGVFAKIPGLVAGVRLLTRVLPLGRGQVIERDGTSFVR